MGPTTLSSWRSMATSGLPPFRVLKHLKCRHGETRDIDLTFDRPHQRFTVDPPPGRPGGRLRDWLAERLARLQSRRPTPVPCRSRPRCPATPPSSTCRAGLVRIFDRDLKLAGIPKRDDRGRTLDVHALRTTFGTLLSQGGVALRTAQAAMRHSDPSLPRTSTPIRVCWT